MSLARWNWLNALTRRLNATFTKAPPPSKFTRRQSLYHRAGPVEALEKRVVPTIMVMGATASEAAGTLWFTIMGINTSSTPLVLNYATADGTANSNALGDFTAVAGSFTAGPGFAILFSVSVPINERHNQ